ncbi:hypothetical protein PoB_006262900 [Plakobranchus ocellatus]|uniref:Uncharacterized protein n=1 Tax=Plakobranchus ocellatus TaxID=259542 RepID=A0AAV4CW42_9GAST|nr:hypothetical protein PoB_006262900 [Plakobranchus ocellatus]
MIAQGKARGREEPDCFSRQRASWPVWFCGSAAVAAQCTWQGPELKGSVRGHGAATNNSLMCVCGLPAGRREPTSPDPNHLSFLTARCVSPAINLPTPMIAVFVHANSKQVCVEMWGGDRTVREGRMEGTARLTGHWWYWLVGHKREVLADNESLTYTHPHPSA